MSIPLDPIRFSVIIPLYNKERSICSTVESVLDQTYTNFELIIINDGSTDDSLKMVQSFSDPRIRIFNKPNGGVSSARNKGIEVSRNEFIIFLDADDFWFPFCLEEFCSLIGEFKDAQVFCTNYNMTGKNLRGSERRYYVEDYYYASSYYMAKWSVSLMLTGCVAIRRDQFEKVGNYNKNISHGEDIDLWERLAIHCKIIKSEKITTIYRTETENRASLQNVGLEASSGTIGKEIGKSMTSSQKLFWGIQFIFDIRNGKLTWNNLKSLWNVIKYSVWVLRSMLFIIKVRVLNIVLFTSNQ